MSKHKRIIGACWMAIGFIFAVLTLVSLYKSMQQHAAFPAQISISAILLCSFYMLAGYALLTNHRRSHWLGLPLALLTIFNVPLGTIISTYYLWYYFKHEWKRADVPPTP